VPMRVEAGADRCDEVRPVAGECRLDTVCCGNRNPSSSTAGVMDSAAEAIVGRIEQILDSRADLSQRGLAERAGLSPTQMNRVMTRQRKITATELAIIAEALDVPATELLGQSTQSLGVAARVGHAERAPGLEGPFARAEKLLETRELLDRVVARPAVEARPEFTVPTRGLEKDRGRSAAVALREQLDVAPEEGIDDLVGLVARFGLDVSTQPLPSNLHGFLVHGGRGVDPADITAVALINSDDTYGRRRFTLAHELAHLVFGDGSLVIADYDQRAAGKDERWTPERLVELRADNFAKSLLAPDAGVLAVADEAGEGPSTPGPAAVWGAVLMARVAARFSVSFESAGYRLNDVGILSDDERVAAEGYGATNAFEKADLADAGAALMDRAWEILPPGTLLAQALAAYQAEELGLKALATLYDLSTPGQLEELRRQLRAAGWEPGAAAGS
jgi:Zn-dependent peptidase ImmA (M78 family)/transcriptional regulator with XRE-family HTH domain